MFTQNLRTMGFMGHWIFQLIWSLPSLFKLMKFHYSHLKFQYWPSLVKILEELLL